MRSEHLAFDELTDLSAGRAEPGAQAHLAGCAQCQASLAWLSQLLGQQGEAGGPSRAGLQALFARRRGGQLRPASYARLHFDSGHRQRAYGLRSGASPERQLVFATEALEVDLRLTPEGREWHVAGQVLGEASAGSAELLGAGGTFRSQLSDMAEFEIAPVPPGDYQLILSLDDADLIIADLQLGTLDAPR